MARGFPVFHHIPPLTETVFVHHIDALLSTQKEQLIATSFHLTFGSSIANALQVLCKSVWPCAAKRYY